MSKLHPELWAYNLNPAKWEARFIHPQTKKEMIFSSLLPKDLNNILKMLRNTEE